MVVLGIITARKNSRRLPNKNVRFLGDKELINWTIDEALKCDCLDYVVIATDLPDINNILHGRGFHYKTIQVFLPEDLTTDDKHIDAILYSIKNRNRFFKLNISFT